MGQNHLIFNVKCDENYEKWGGYMFLGGQTHLVHDTKWERGGGSSQIFSEFPLSDHGVHAKIVQTPRPPDCAGFAKHWNVCLLYFTILEALSSLY